MLPTPALAEEIAWLSDSELDNLADILIRDHPTRATQLVKKISIWRQKVTPRPISTPAPAPAPQRRDQGRISNWWR